MGILRKILTITRLYNTVTYITSDKKKFLNLKGHKKIFFMLIPTYGNLGDQAIEYATEKLLRENCAHCQVVPVLLEDTYSSVKAVDEAYEAGDLIVLQGGGNFGNLYLEVEKARRFVVKKLKRATIVSFPSTCTYTDSLRGKFELYLSKKAYNNAPNFTVFSREAYSGRRVNEYFPKCMSYVVPDTVFALGGSIPTTNGCRQGALICLRQDRESVLKDKYSDVLQIIDKNFSQYSITDTLVPRSVNEKTRGYEIKAKINEFAKYQVVVTDRIHGMIFALLSGTPCVGFESLDKKIVGTYEWIKEFQGVKLINNPEDVMAAIDSVTKIGPYEYSKVYNAFLADKYDVLTSYLSGF